MATASADKIVETVLGVVLAVLPHSHSGDVHLDPPTAPGASRPAVRAVEVPEPVEVYAFALSPDASRVFAWIGGTERPVAWSRLAGDLGPPLVAWLSAAAAMLAFELLSRKGVLPGKEHCRDCNYCLEGIAGPRCPECGRDAGPAGRVRGRIIRWRRGWWLYGLGVVPAACAGGYLGYRGLVAGDLDPARYRPAQTRYRVVEIDPADGRITATLFEPSAESTWGEGRRALAVGPDGRSLFILVGRNQTSAAGGAWEMSVREWSLAAGRFVREFEPPARADFLEGGLSFSPDGRMLLAKGGVNGGPDRLLIGWPLSGEPAAAALDAPPPAEADAWMLSRCWTPKTTASGYDIACGQGPGRRLALGWIVGEPVVPSPEARTPRELRRAGLAGRLHLTDAATGTALAALEHPGPPGGVMAILSRDGRTLATVGLSGTEARTFRFYDVSDFTARDLSSP
jgi:hypothetical protein